MITVEEAKEIMYNESSINHAGVEYEKITALIFRNLGGSFRASAELLDKNRRSVTVVGLDRLHLGDWTAEVDTSTLGGVNEEGTAEYTDNQEKELNQ